MRRATLVLAVFFGCAPEEPEVPQVVFPLPMNLDQCVSTMATDPPLQARLVIEELDISCPLTVTISEDKRRIDASGTCADIPVSQMSVEPSKLVLEWYVVSPLAKKHIVVAEQQAQLELSTKEIKDREVEATFDPDKFPVFTKAGPLQTAADKDRFNCDRHGQLSASESPCDSNKPVTQAISDKDNCSNLEELCKGTLFAATNDLGCTD